MFGPKVGQYGLLAHLYEPQEDNNTGCHVLINPPLEDEWIALIKRGGCSFYTKVNAMQQSGAIAVIIGDDKNDVWLTMTTEGDSSNITIPSVFLSKSEYHSFLLAKQNLIHPILVLLNNEDKILWSFTIDYFYYGFIFIPLMLLCLVSSYLYYQQRKSYHPYLHHHQQQSILHIDITTTMDPKELDYYLPKQLVTKSITPNKNTDEEEDDDECPICLDPFRCNDEIRVLPCQHSFHVTCIDGWLTTYKTKCCVCTRDIYFDKKKSTLSDLYLPV
ncbi:unnamed protein product [Cunninghamella echinulata]